MYAKASVIDIDGNAVFSYSAAAENGGEERQKGARWFRQYSRNFVETGLDWIRLVAGVSTR